MSVTSAIDPKSALLTCLKALRLPTIRAQFESIARQAVNENLSYEQFLYELVSQEYTDRTHKRNQRLLKESKLPLEKTLEQFDLNRLSPKLKQQVQQLLTGDFLKRTENVLAFGTPGTGKTHLLCAVAQELIRKGHAIYFTSCSLLVQDLLRAKKNLNLAKHLKLLARFEAIFIDDIGYVQQQRDEMEVLFTLLADRYERSSIILTSNLPFSKWEQIFKDPMTTAAAIDRLVHHCLILEFNLPSFRLHASISAQGGDAKPTP